MADLNAVQERLSPFFWSWAGLYVCMLLPLFFLPLSLPRLSPLSGLALQNELAIPARSCVLGLLPPPSDWPAQQRWLPLITTHQTTPHRAPRARPSPRPRGKRGSSLPPGGCMRNRARAWEGGGYLHINRAAANENARSWRGHQR